MASVDRTPLDEGWIFEREKALAWLRIAFAVLAIVVIQLNPARVARFPVLSSFSLAGFLFYSLSILYLVRHNAVGSGRLVAITTPLDVAWIALIVFSTGGSRTPFFTYYSFPVISASLRWGIKGSLPVAFAGVAIYFGIRMTLAAESGGEPIGIDTVVVRGFYLIALAAIFGYISEFERKQNQKLLALSHTAGQISALQERRRIMFDLHDGILQSLATLILRLEHCREKLADSNKIEIEKELSSMEELTRNSMNDIRQFLSGKEAKPLIHGTLLTRLREELRFLQQDLNMEVILEIEPEEVDLPETIETEVYYVLRESLANVTRHSQASRIDLRLSQRDHLLQGNIEDNGAGMNLTMQDGKGLGLQSMRERIKKLGGELFIKSSPGGGTRISFSVPLAN